MIKHHKVDTLASEGGKRNSATILSYAGKLYDNITSKKNGIAIHLKDKLLVKVFDSDYHKHNNNIKEESVKWDKKGRKKKESRGGGIDGNRIPHLPTGFKKINRI